MRLSQGKFHSLLARLSCKSAAGDTQLVAIMQKYSRLHRMVIMVKNVKKLTVLIVTLLPTSAAPVVVSAIASDAQKAAGDALCCARSVGACLHYAALCIEEQLRFNYQYWLVQDRSAKLLASKPRRL